jgi:metal-responsive CopG/Arc/MetJ family transcriptional regulator
MIGLRLADEVTVKVDEWADRHGIPTRSEAIRRMIDKVLACHEAQVSEA